MNTAPIFSICQQDPVVTSLIGSNPLRLYMFGLAPQSPTKPYAVWQVIGGQPENYMDGRPDIDGFTIQIDTYADSASIAGDVAGAIRHAIEPHCMLTSYRGESRDDQTMNYRSGFDVDWLVER
ncbi:MULTISPECIES: DUF3168 domain-containing protein [unclassified Vibrio]|uniref:DUF3168 domain-containing protein n=1 Tax=unclassified Vibrio TaxID=2614977 RepID=UPI000B8E3380|nr:MULTISPECIES: DUF3168 domain-containing protein [unclassified Vibrio]NAX17182.1 DUF3168 domain-containing protein [Vibrio sp. V22_P2S10T140]OXX39643.1 hypothetical protein B9J83_15085 [Vibrio sp. V07_P2A8T137]OXX58192.1 hypothetical protein B9J82_08885 [Vibrio sp. V10_P2A27P122]PSD42859.1 DUF3168 domain-containing protein [Vibrio sp. V02_P2A34T13]